MNVLTRISNIISMHSSVIMNAIFVVFRQLHTSSSEIDLCMSIFMLISEPVDLLLQWTSLGSDFSHQQYNNEGASAI